MRGEMHHGIHTAHDLGQSIMIDNVGHHQLKAIGQESMAAGQVVVDDNFISATP